MNYFSKLDKNPSEGNGDNFERKIWFERFCQGNEHQISPLNLDGQFLLAIMDSWWKHEGF